jgi:plasmid stabilization system protein ParE
VAEVRWQPGALDHLEEIYNHLAEDNRSAARRLVEQIIAATERLSEFPESGRVAPQFDDPQVREVIVRKYRIAYRPKENVVAIAAVHHGARDLVTQELLDD